jgi:uncharacterized delta-60 repeat protein
LDDEERNMTWIQARGFLRSGAGHVAWASRRVPMLTLFALASVGQGSAQVFDSTFNATVGPSAGNRVESVALQPDGKILIGGFFSEVNGVERRGVARLNPNGSLDATFNPPFTANPGYIGAIAVQADGRILVGGTLPAVAGLGATELVRLNADGSTDLAFNPRVGGRVDELVVMADGRILVAGQINQLAGVPLGNEAHLVRLQAGGARDGSFGAAIMGGYTEVVAVAVQADGKILIGGSFTTTGVAPHSYFTRLNSDGTRDATFLQTSVNGVVWAIVVRPTNRILIGGVFDTAFGEPRGSVRGIVQLNPDGSRDTTFTPDFNAGTNVDALALRADGRVWVGGIFSSVEGRVAYNVALLTPEGLLDLTYPHSATLQDRVLALALQPDGKVVMGGRFHPYPPPSLSAPSDIARLLPAPDDPDGDGLPTPWELQFGLDPASGAGENGSLGDPDGDVRTNVQELQAGTHPRGLFVPSLAEGALNTFFDVRLAFLNVGGQDARVWLRFLQPGGVTATYFKLLPPNQRWTLGRSDLTILSSPDFSTVIESDQPIVVDRTMTWDASGYGSHAETAVARPTTTWYLAEGSTSGEFALFYLLQNPNPVSVAVTVRYLLPFGQTPLNRTLTLPPNSRTTIPVDDQGPELASTDVSAVITAAQPIIVERAMYISRPGQPFAAGHGSAGVTAPSLSWFLAEGATGPFFDLFVLLANPNAQAATVSATYLLLDGSVLSKSYVVPANSRFTIWVDDEQIPVNSGLKPLANVAVSTTITSTNSVPIIVERTMWWPSPELTPVFWTEAHNSPGATQTGTRWALAEGEVGGPQSAETYILIANTSATAGEARVTLYFEDGTTAARIVSLLARSRTNVPVSSAFPEAAQKRFASLVQSLGTTPAEIVVERAMYTSPGGATWAAGTNALATRLP